VPDSRVVDTNVLIVASAADDGSPFRPEATPVQEAALRQKVLDWLTEFTSDTDRHLVLDYDWHLCSEYRNKLTEQDYGWLAVMGKLDRNEIVWIGLTLDDGRHAVLPRGLATAVTDLADRKIVAAALAAINDEYDCRITNACDTDWLDYGDALAKFGIEVEHVIEAWLRAKWAAKKRR